MGMRLAPACLALTLLAGVAAADSSLPALPAGAAPDAAPACSDAAAETEPLYAEGRRLIAAGKPDAARATWFRLVKERPASPFIPDVYLRFAELYSTRGDLEAARQFYRRVLAFPELRCRAFTLTRLGRLEAARGDHTEALASFVRALDASDASPALAADARRGVVAAFARVGRPSSARAFFLRIAPAHADEMLRALAATPR
jgi:tetratricopeptide (TPR) repeat protein